ncbi:MAG TPA: hypothetical protein VEH06_03940 [Candidatus Bathyarchaeia archaeon]|nr:hypothetical protein [Candidatus Bathyarchaeia archaeon]
MPNNSLEEEMVVKGSADKNQPTDIGRSSAHMLAFTYGTDM